MELDVRVRHDRAKLYIETVLPLVGRCIPSIFMNKNKKSFETVAENFVVERCIQQMTNENIVVAHHANQYE